MSRPRLAAVILLFEDEPDPPSVRSDADTTLEELDEPSRIHPRGLARCVPAPVEQRRKVSR